MSFMLGITPWPVVSAHSLDHSDHRCALSDTQHGPYQAIQAAAQGLHRSFRLASKAV